MPATVYPIEIDVGAEFRLPIVYLAPDGSPYDLTGWTAKMQVRANATGDLLLEASTSNGQIVTSTGGSIDIRIPSGAVATVPPGKYQYDLFLKPISGDYQKILMGSCIVIGSITKLP